jgi:leader peptidase (prepilin peptidase) / N-methyltransferase
MGADPLLVLAFAFVAGTVVGSFLNVVVHRLPRMLEHAWRADCAELLGEPRQPPMRYNLLTPASHCPHCNAPVAAANNIPVLGYLALRGRCARCKARIAPRYLLVEFGTGIAGAIVAATFGVGLAGLAAFGFACTLIALAAIDFEHLLLPDALTLPLLWVGLTVNIAGTFTGLEDAVLGTILGYLSLWSVHQLFRWITGREGIGAGDFKLLAALGAWLGWQALPLIVIVGSGAGAAVGLALIAMGRSTRERPLPFGVFLAAAGFIAMLWGDALTQAYQRFAGLAG